jgi:hypothetical protein
MNVALGTPDSRTGGNSTIAHLRVVFIKGVGIYKPSPELITNGGFDTTADWTLGNNWTISGGTLSGAATTSFTYQADVCVVGYTYLVTYTILNYVSGTVSINCSGVAGTPRSANGTYTELIVAGGLGRVRIDGGSAFTGDIDNVSVKEVKALIK